MLSIKKILYWGFMKIFFTLMLIVFTYSLFAQEDLNHMMGDFEQTGDGADVLCPDRLDIQEIVCDQENENGELGILLRQVRNDAWGRIYPLEVIQKSDVRFCQINGDKIKTKYRYNGNFWGPNNMDYVEQSRLNSSDDEVNLQKITKWTERSYLMKISSGMEVIKLNFQRDNMSKIVQVQLSIQGIWYALNADASDHIRTMSCVYKRP